jgi:hypothetical protein
MRYILSLILIQFLFCTSHDLVQEPTLDQTTIQSATICTEFIWYSPFCSKNKPKSVSFKGIYQNTSNEKKYYIDYVLDNSDIDIPVGLSIQIDGTFYNLKKMATDYVDIFKITSEIPEEILNKIVNSKNHFVISYSSRRDTFNYSLSDSKSKDLANEAEHILKKMKSVSKMKIMK